MYYGLEAFDDFTGLGAQTAEQCAKIQAKIDAAKASLAAGGTTAQNKKWDATVTQQTKLLNKCLESAGLPPSGTDATSVPEAGAVADASSGILSNDWAKAAAIVAAGKVSPEAQAALTAALNPLAAAAVPGAHPGAPGSKGSPMEEELIWGIPKGVVYVIGGVVGVGILLTLLLQKRGGSSPAAAPAVAPELKGALDYVV
jgi:hypothetical protein